MLGKGGRDPRLDFFRGSAMFIIFVAHARGDVLWRFIPARFGLSDSADMFVFLSGMAAAIAFGGTFMRHGMAMGIARILYRCWQLFVGHLGLFFTMAAIIVFADRGFGDTDYVAVLQLHRFFTDTPGALADLFTLRYVPHYFDILPLYIVVLAMVPGAMLLARIHPLLAPAASIALYLVTVALGLNLPANADNQAVWYFNPFAWQLIFFTGFSIGRGWIAVPLDSRLLLWGSAALVALALAVCLPAVFTRIALLDLLRQWVQSHSDKTDLDPLRYAHFLALAYIAVVLLRGRERILLGPLLAPLVKCGQQALAVFLSGMVLAHLGGMVFDHAGTGAAAQIAVNGIGFVLLVAVAYVVAWFKAAPWKQRPALAPIKLPAGHLAAVPGE